MDSITVYALPMDDYLITAEVIDDAISISVELEHEIVLNLFEYPAEITVLSAKISEVEEVSNEANSAATTALAAAASAQSSADAAMAQAEAATDMSATNTLSISNILSNFTSLVLGTYLGALTLLDAAIAAGDSLQAMAGKIQGQLNAVKVRLGLLENNVILDINTDSDLAFIDFNVQISKNEVVIFNVKTPATLTSTNYRMQLNDVVSGYYATGTASDSGILISMLGLIFNAHHGRLVNDGLNVSYQGTTTYKTGTSNPATAVFNGGINGLDRNITKIRITPLVGVIAAGTTFKIYK